MNGCCMAVALRDVPFVGMFHISGLEGRFEHCCLSSASLLSCFSYFRNSCLALVLSY